jgi:hypothetical protein
MYHAGAIAGQFHTVDGEEADLEGGVGIRQARGERTTNTAPPSEPPTRWRMLTCVVASDS